MKTKSLAVCALILSGTLLFHSCIGSFALTGKVYEWNKGVGTKFVNELVFLVCCIVPVYEVALAIDAIVVNSVEFWSGENPAIAKTGQVKKVKGENGEYLVKNLENGYEISKDGQTANLIYNRAAGTWNLVADGISRQLLKINNDGTANLYLPGGETMNVTLDAHGVLEARAATGNGVHLAAR